MITKKPQSCIVGAKVRVKESFHTVDPTHNVVQASGKLEVQQVNESIASLIKSFCVSAQSLANMGLGLVLNSASMSEPFYRYLNKFLCLFSRYAGIVS